MDAEIRSSTLRGAASAPPSKSYTHRAILAAGYGDGATIEDPLWSADTRATARAVEAFGGDVEQRGDGAATTGESADLDDAPIEEDVDRTLAEADEPAGEASPDDLLVEGFDGRPAVPEDVIDCANSGTTMRLTTATAALADGLSVLTGDESLRSRPQGPLLDAIEQVGGRAESTRGNGQAPLVVGGRASDGVGGTAPIEGGTASIPGDVSSQFVTALLMAGAVTEDGIEVELETELKSAPYVDVTIEVLADFGVDATETDAGYAVEGGQTYEPDGGTYAVPGDFSSMSYLLAAGAVAAPDGLRVRGARPSAQGDSAIVDTLEEMGADLEWDRDAGVIEVSESDLTGTTVGVADTPDLLPTIAVLGAIADGTTEIVDAEHVRYKETDRVSAMAEALDRMGASVEEREDALVVRGGEADLQGATVDGRADHRVIMSLAVAGLVADGATTITGAEHVDVSFPGFFDTLYDLGADVRQVE